MIQIKKDLIIQYKNNILKVLANILYKNKVIIFIGINGTYLYAISKAQIVDNIFLPYNNDINNSYIKFINKYKRYYFCILLDNDTNLRHESIPALQSVIKSNQIEWFIADLFSKEHIIAYDKYENKNNNEDSISVVIASTEYKGFLSQVIFYILENSLKFGGIYFLSLESINIIKQFNLSLKSIDKNLNLTITKSNNTEEFNSEEKNYQDTLYILVFITKVSGIQRIIAHDNNIISFHTTDFPVDKSDEYIQGIIEQEINDNILIQKNYIANLNLKTKLVLCIGNNMYKLLSKSSFPVTEVLYVTKNNIEKNYQENESFVDDVISYIFASHSSFVGKNKLIKTISNLDLINKFIFKPFLVFAVLLLTFIVLIKVETIMNFNKINVLNNKYYNMIVLYKDIQKEREIDDITKLLELYEIKQLLKAPILIPYDTIKYSIITLIENPKIQIIKSSWLYNNENNSSIELSIKYFANNISIIDALYELQQYIEKLRNNLPNFSIRYEREVDSTINTYGNVILPIKLYISKQ